MRDIRRIIREEIDNLVRDNVDGQDVHDMVFVTYGSSSFNGDKFEKPRINDWSFSTNKPIGCLWASPLNSRYGWQDWAADEGFRPSSLDSHFMFTLAPDANIYIIDSREDFERMSFSTKNWHSEGLNDRILNFEALIYDYDGYFVTQRGVAVNYDLRSYDVESLCITNKDVIVPYEPDAFQTARAHRYQDTMNRDPNMEARYGDREARSMYGNRDRQMDRDRELYGNQNLRSDMSSVFGGEHPAILAQRGDERARRFNGTIKSGM